MKIALIGAGKTGHKVAEVSSSEPTIFNKSNPPTLEKLQEHDVIISFLPGEPFAELIPLLIESRIPVVSGSTGVNWPVDIHQQLTGQKLTWITASNFSLGMNLVKEMISILSKASKIYGDYKFEMEEIHHTKKVDAPSGTALSWKEWLGEETEIESKRIGDVIGIHELKLQTKYEQISVRHESKDRSLFAEGALWAAEKILKIEEYGLLKFEEIVKKELI